MDFFSKTLWNSSFHPLETQPLHTSQMMTRQSKNIGRPCKNHVDRPGVTNGQVKIGKQKLPDQCCTTKTLGFDAEKTKFSSPGDDPAVTFVIP